MSKRDYSHEAYAQMVQTIRQIDDTDVQPLRDIFGDLFLRIGQFLQLYSAEQYQSDMQRWYDLVLDSHNTTVRKLDDIFNAVETVDFNYRDILDDALSSIVDFRNTVNCLRDVISGKLTPTEGKSAAAGYLASGQQRLIGRYDELLTKLEQKALWDASKELFGDALKWGAGFGSICLAKDPLAKAAAIKKFADSTWATAHDLLAMGSILVTPITGIVGSQTGMDYGDYLDYRFDQLTKSQEQKGTNSVSDWLGGIAEDMTENLEDCPENSPFYSVVKAASDISNGVHHAYEAVDIAVDAYDILSGLKDTHDNIDEWINGKAYTPEEFAEAFDKKDYWEIVDYTDGPDGTVIYAKGSPAEIIFKIVSDRTGLPLSGWDDSGKRTGNTYKTAGTIWSYLDKLLPNADGTATNSDIADVFFGKVKDIGTLKDVFDFARDLDEWVSWEKPTVPFTGTGHDPSKIPLAPSPGILK